MERFKNRSDAGQKLAASLAAYRQEQDLVVLALPRGGVPVAYEVAKAFGAPLDVFVVRKLGVPGHQEFAMGAIASGGITVLNHAVIRDLGITQDEIDTAVAAESREISRRERTYRGGKPPLSLAGKTVVLVDDGLATGATMRAAIRALKPSGVKRIIVAVPVAPLDICEGLRREVDHVVCLHAPLDFWAVGLWYADFAQTSDEAVRTLLAAAHSDIKVNTERNHSTGDASIVTLGPP